MSYRKEVITAAGTLAVALGVGYVMQGTDGAEAHYGASSVATASVAAAAPAARVADTGGAVAAELDVQDIELTSATTISAAPDPGFDAAIKRIAAPADSALAVPEQDDRAPVVGACDMTAQARALPGAMVRLSFEAACSPNERVTVHHNGLMFTQTTNDAGGLSLMVPALASEAVFIFAFANGEGAVAQTQVDDVDQYSRVALQWRGPAGFELHAREFGANYGDAGHVSAQTEADIAGLRSGQNGFLMRLGNEEIANPLVAEVYTFATSVAAQSGTIDLSVEAEVTERNCGQKVEAQSLIFGDMGDITTHDLELTVPQCDGVGDFLVLNNLIPDMKVAAN